MSQKTVTELMIRFMSDEVFRCKLLHKEETGLSDFDLDNAKRIDVLQLDENEIISHIAKEIDDATVEEIRLLVKWVFQLAGVDLEAARAEIHGAGMAPLEASAYSEGSAHIRGIEPETIKVGVETMVEIRGQGFTHSLTVQAIGPGNTIDAEIVSQSCDVDLNQRVLVRLTIPEAGDWELEVNPKFADDLTDKKPITVVP